MRFEGPLGSFTLSESDAPILMVAGATGLRRSRAFLRMRSCAVSSGPCGCTGCAPTVRLLPARRRAGLGAATCRFPFQSCCFRNRLRLISGRAGSVWCMKPCWPIFRVWLVMKLYVCGSVRMVDAAVPDSSAHGLSADACFSDAFVPARAALSGARHVTRPPARP